MTKPKLAVIVGGNLAAAGPGDKDNIDGLGTAATRDVGESDGDVMGVGTFGIGTSEPTEGDTLLEGGNRIVNRSTGDGGLPNVGGYSDRSSVIALNTEGHQSWIQITDQGLYYAWEYNPTSLPPFIKALSTNDIAQATGNSTASVMSQKAITDALTNAGALAPSSATYVYSATGQVEKIVTPEGNTVIAYNPNGTVDTITYPTGRVESYTYDATGNVTAMTATGG